LFHQIFTKMNTDNINNDKVEAPAADQSLGKLTLSKIVDRAALRHKTIVPLIEQATEPTEPANDEPVLKKHVRPNGLDQTSVDDWPYDKPTGRTDGLPEKPAA
jgi:hypothetical protein